MKLLFRREQTEGGMRRVQFKLWAKIEVDDDEQAIIKRYSFADAILIYTFQPGLLRTSAMIGVGAFVAAFIILWLSVLGSTLAAIVSLVAGCGAGYWWFTEKRETIYVRDLLHGRNFICPSVVGLARKEAELANICATLRQVMESAKHWDGTETIDVPVLPKEQAKLAIL